MKANTKPRSPQMEPTRSMAAERFLSVPSNIQKRSTKLSLTQDEVLFVALPVSWSLDSQTRGDDDLGAVVIFNDTLRQWSATQREVE